MTHLRPILISLLTGLIGLQANAQVISPEPPKTYDVEFRYRIRAGRNVRLVQYFQMLAYLKSIGFEKNPGPTDEPENANYIRMTGKIPSANARRLLEEPHIKSVILYPPGYQAPEAEDEPVKVQLQLPQYLPQQQQRRLRDQTIAHLQELGFRNAIAYDHRRFSRIVGWIPAGQVQTLFYDLRWQPSGWLVPDTSPSLLPSPLRETSSPIRLTEIIPEPEGVAPIAGTFVPEVPANEDLQKTTPALRAFIAKEKETGRPVRIEAIFVVAPPIGDKTWQRDLIKAVPQFAIEGQLGPIITGTLPAGNVLDLAKLPYVSTLRRAVSGAPQLRPADAKAVNDKALEASGVARLHARGFHGQGIRVGIISSDFRGYTALLGKGLPQNTSLIDLTMERNSKLEPEAYPEDGIKIGYGTQAALAAAQAAPKADLVLIRVGAASPYQLMQIARRINGEYFRSITQDSRQEDLGAEREHIRRRWDTLMFERRVLFANFNANEETKKKRLEHFQKVKDLQAEEKLYRLRIDRFVQLERDLKDMAKLNVVVSTLSWHNGHPIDGSSALSRYLDNRPFENTIWLQPSGDIHNQNWAGLFRDDDDNGVMDFAGSTAKLRPGRWTNELNFLAWQPLNGKQSLDLPAKARIRLSIQWREAHDPTFLEDGEDVYRQPLANPILLLLRQRDPTGKLLATDDIELSARSAGLPQRIDNRPDSATYLQTLTFTIKTPGRYALRVDGFAPTDIRPRTVANLPANQKGFDLRPRILIEVLDADSRKAGRAVILDYPTNEGAIGMLGAASSVLTIGSANSSAQPRPFSAQGPAMNLRLLLKPNALSFDALATGNGKAVAYTSTSLAAAFAAGQTAALLSAGMRPRSFWQSLPRRPEQLFQVPEGWPRQRPAR